MYKKTGKGAVVRSTPTRAAKPEKPAKPTADFPLFAHASGKWAKKIQGKTHYFGTWAEPYVALAEYERQFLGKCSDGIDAKPGRPALPPKPLTVYDACQHFLSAKDQGVESSETARRTFMDYLRTCKRFSEFVGPSTPIMSLMPSHFAEYKANRAKTCNAVTVGNEVTRVKTMLNWLRKSKLTGEIDTGPDFRKPNRKVMRRHRRQRGKLSFDAAQVRAIMDESGVHLRAMILLGINCGFQNSDVERLPKDHVIEAIRTGWIEFPREKTEVERRCPLWTITRKTLQRSLNRRIDSELPNFFLQNHDKPFDPLNNDVAKRFRTARGYALVDRGGFSWLRKTFATAAASAKDREARDYIMGHVDHSMSALYVQEIWDDRLRDVTKAVARWLYPEKFQGRRKQQIAKPFRTVG